jgi:hypothetical protein
MKYAVVLFHTTSAVMQAEKILKKAGFTIKLIPTPRQFSTDCGISIRFEADRQEAVRDALNNSSIEFDTIKPMESGS